MSKIGHVCALCFEYRKLKRSHIIPNAIFRNIKKHSFGKLISFDNSRDELVEYSIESWWEPLLCCKCESNLSQHEKISIETLRAAAKRESRTRTSGITLRDFNYTALKLFTTSLLWRAAVSNRAPFLSVSLPDLQLEQARVSLLSGRPLNPRKLACRIVQLFDPTPTTLGGFSEKALKQLIVSPIPRLRGRYMSYVFVLEGYLLEFFVPSIPSAELTRNGVLRDTKILYIPKKNIFEVQELVGLMLAGYRKSELGMVKFRT